MSSTGHRGDSCTSTFGCAARKAALESHVDDAARVADNVRRVIVCKAFGEQQFLRGAEGGFGVCPPIEDRSAAHEHDVYVAVCIHANAGRDALSE